jgi:predicted nucleic acid-binding protein
VCYFDTSFLVPLVLAEATSTAIARFVGDLPEEQLVASVWTRVEVGSLLGIRVRRGEMSVASAREAHERFETLFAKFELLVPEADDYALASELLSDFGRGLRSGDALHLAVALTNSAATLFSLDRAVLRVGLEVGLEATTGVSLPGHDMPQ